MSEKSIFALGLKKTLKRWFKFERIWNGLHWPFPFIPGFFDRSSIEIAFVFSSMLLTDSYNCQGANGILASMRKIYTICYQISCPFWSQWMRVLPCSVSCGGGNLTLISDCFYNGSDFEACNGKCPLLIPLDIEI